MVRESAAENVVPPCGEFEYDPVADQLRWTDAMFDIFRLPRGSEPTLEELLTFSHPDDTQGRSGIIKTLLEKPGISTYAYRIVRTDGAVRNVVLVGRSVDDESGKVVLVTGQLIDITEHMGRAMSHRVGDALGGIVDARAEIEQAKGILMVGFGVSAEKAFDLLAWQSQAHNIKVRDLASQIVADAQWAFSLPQTQRDALGRLLMTAHERVKARP